MSDESAFYQGFGRATTYSILYADGQHHRTAEVRVWALADIARSLSLGVLTTAGGLHLTFRYMRTLLSDRAAADFASRYDEALRRLASHGATS